MASPQTQIAFRGVPVKQIGTVVVTGSTTGPHAGRIASDSDGDGGSFLPTKPFVPGEVVTVRTGLHVVGAIAGTFRFTVADAVGLDSGDAAVRQRVEFRATSSRSTRDRT